MWVARALKDCTYRYHLWMQLSSQYWRRAVIFSARDLFLSWTFFMPVSTPISCSRVSSCLRKDCRLLNQWFLRCWLRLRMNRR